MRGQRRRRWWLGAAALVVVTLVVPVAPASSEPYEDGAAPWAGSQYSNAVRPGWNTSSSADRVHDIAQIGNRIYIAGSFAGIRPGTSGGVSHRAHLIALRADTGQPIWSFSPRFNGPVFTLAVSDDRTRLYAGGAFTTVDGLARQRMVALRPGGGVDRVWRAQVTGGDVRAIVATRSYLYIGGAFKYVNGVGRQRLARLRRAQGHLDGAWRAGAWSGTVLTLEMPPARNRIYVGGRFANINGWGNTKQLAALRTQDGRVDAGFSAQPGREVFDLLADARGRVWAALGGAGGRAEVYGNRGQRIGRWDTNGDVQAVELIGDRVFFAGHEMIPDDRQVASVSYAEPRTWDTWSFKPGIIGGDGIWALHADGRHLWVGTNSRGPFHGFGRYPAR